MKPKPRDAKGRVNTGKKAGNVRAPLKITRHYVVTARNAPGTVRMVYTGEKFSNSERAKPYYVRRQAFNVARNLVLDFPVLATYRVGVEQIKHQAYYKNPATRQGTKLRVASKLLEEFSGHEASETLRINEPELKAGLAVGPILGVMYETVRDGKRERYIHKFRASSRPLLAASHDGKKLGIIGGRFQFTAAGIEDR